MERSKAPKDTNIVIDDNVLEMVGNLLKGFSAEDQGDKHGGPTVEELRSLLNLGLQVNADNGIFGSGGFDRGPVRKSTLSEPQRWALATSAIPKKANDMELDVLGGGVATKIYIIVIREMLERDWEITDRSGAIATIGWLKDQGHREEFDLMLQDISQLDDIGFDRLVKEYADDPEVRKQLKLVYSIKNTIGNKSIIGWDYCRIVYLAECCCVAGYLTEEEAWQEIMPATKVIQSTFSSWKEMSDNYLLGRKFWSGGSEPMITSAVKFLLSDKTSPWVNYAWNLSME
jgi:hypothetical protein